MDVKTIILGALIHESMTGYELKKLFSISFVFFSGLSYGSIYPALRKMEKEGLISLHVEIQDGAPNRKVYTITEAGRKAFLQAVKSPVEVERNRNSFLMQLFFFSHLEPEERHIAADAYLKSIKSAYASLEALGSEIEARADRFQYLCYQFGLRYLEDLANNVAKTIEALKEGLQL